MTTAVQHRRGTTAEHSTFTGLEGEVTIDTTKDTAVIHDGVLAGGYPLAKENLANVTTSGLSSIDGASTASDDKFFIYDQSATTLKTSTRAELNNAIEQDALANVAITGGTINGTAIGGTTAAAGAFSTLSASGAVTLSGGTANSIPYLNGSKVLTTGSALTFTGTALGVNVATPLSALHVVDGGGVLRTFDNTDGIILTSYSSSKSIGFSTSSAGNYGSDGGSNTFLKLTPGASGTMIFGASGSEQMRLTSTGLGIGTSSPGYKLDVTGPGTVGGSTLRLNDQVSGGNSKHLLLTRGSSTASIGIAGSQVNDPLWLSRSGSYDLLIDSSGNLGLGVTPSGKSKFEVATGNVAQNGVQVWYNSSNTPIALANTTSNAFPYVGFNTVQKTSSDNQTYAIGNYASRLKAYGGGFSFDIAGSGTAGADISWTQAMTLDASGNLGIGTTIPQTRLTLAKGTGNTAPTTITGANAFLNIGLAEYGASSNGKYMISFGYFSGATNAPAYIGLEQTATGSYTKGDLTFYTRDVTTDTAPTERARIDSSGNLLVGATSSTVSASAGVRARPDGTLQGTRTESTNAVSTMDVYSTGASAYRFYVGMGGTIYATSTTITAISDQRLKENIQDLDVGLDKIMALKPRKFDWKPGKGKDKKGDRGWIAQEFEQVFPDMITTWKDEPPEGEEPYKAVNADLIPVLVKAIQEQQAIINQLKARLDAANL